MRGDNPFAGLIGRGEQADVADRNLSDLAGQAERGQDFGHGNRRVAGQHVLQIVIGKFHRVDREAVRDRRDGLRVGVDLRLQLFSGQRTGFPGDMVDVGGEVFVRGFAKGEGDLHRAALGGLELVSLGVQHADIKGISGCDVAVVLAHLVHRGVRLPLLVQQRAGDGEGRVVRERARFRAHRDLDAVQRARLFEGQRLGRERLQRDGDRQRGVQHREGDALRAHIPFRLRGVGVFARQEQEGAVRLRGRRDAVRVEDRDFRLRRDDLKHHADRLRGGLVGGFPLDGFALGFPLGFPLGRFALGRFPLGLFVLSLFPLGRFALGRFPLSGFALGRFILGGFPLGGFPLDGGRFFACRFAVALIGGRFGVRHIGVGYIGIRYIGVGYIGIGYIGVGRVGIGYFGVR